MSTPEDRFERLVAEMLAGSAPARPPASLVPSAEQEVATTRRWPRWYATLRERPMRYSSTVAIGSPAARLATILVATMLLVAAVVGAGIAGSSLVSTTSSIVVDQSGAGDTTTIAEAVAMAQDGDEILVRPGTYVEAVTVSTAITIRGDGPREDILLVAPADGTAEPYALVLTGSDATISNMAIRGAVFVRGGASATVIGNDIGGPITLDSAGHVTLSDNEAWTLTVDAASSATAQGNTFASPLGEDKAAIAVEQRKDRGVETPVVIEGNRIVGPFAYGISIINTFGPRPLVSGNTVSNADVGVLVNGSGPLSVAENVLSGNATGIRVGVGAVASFTGNAIEDNDIGMTVFGPGTRPTMAGNRFCGNDTDLDVPPGSKVTLANDDVCESLPVP